MVDQNQVEGNVRNLAGKAQETFGNVTGDTRTQAQGMANQAAGRLQDSYGAAVETMRDTASRVADRTREQPIAAVLIAAAVGYLIGRLGRYI